MTEEASSNQTLKEQLDATRDGMVNRLPAEVIETIGIGNKQIRESMDMDKVINVGDKAPDFELPDATGNTVRLSNLLNKGPVLFTWYRGNW